MTRRSTNRALVGAPPFNESAAWQSVGDGGQSLHGDFHAAGFSMEWHDFATEENFDWSPSFRPSGVEICLNLAGRGTVGTSRRQLEFSSQTAGFYLQRDSRLEGTRAGGERHQFLTVELSRDFITRHIDPEERGLHPALKSFAIGKKTAEVSTPLRLTSEQQQLALSLRRPPVAATGRRMWYQAKALELASVLFFEPGAGEELFCQRCKRQSRERVERVLAVLRENLAEPPSLEEIGRRVGCSPFYLSRIFSQEMGCGIFQHLRRLRMERAAELLRQGQLNVTEVALEVGYASPSHFGTVFHETYGCCPGLYPLKIPTQFGSDNT